MGLLNPGFLRNATSGEVMLSSTAEQLQPQPMGRLLHLRRGTLRC
jgi:hypothetical protein